MTNSLLKSIQRFIVKRFWPWFIEYAWPLIKEEVIIIFAQVLNFIRRSLEDYFNNRNETQQKNMKEQAEEAERQAETALDEVEAAKWRGKAEAYREQAITLQEENEQLRRKIEQIMREGIDNARSDIENINIEIKDSKQLEFGSKSIPLPGTDEELSSRNEKDLEP